MAGMGLLPNSSGDWCFAQKRAEKSASVRMCPEENIESAEGNKDV